MTTIDKQSFLKQKFLEYAYVKDAAQGYVVVEGFNLAIDPDVLQFASRCWAQQYHHQTHIDAIVGLPDAGARLVSILGEMLRVRYILPSKRTRAVPGAWRNVVSFSNASFTTQLDDVESHIGFVKPGMNILVVDDLVAHGDTAVAALRAIEQAGANVVGMCVLFDKVWQGGVERIKTETGVDVFSLIRIQEITNSGEIILE